MAASSNQQEIRVPRGSEDQGRLTFSNGVAGLQIVAGSPGDDLCHVTHDGAAPEVDATGGNVRVRYPGISAWPQHKGPVVVALHPEIPWTIDIDAGAEDTAVRSVPLASFSVRGAKGLTLDLGKPEGTVPVSLGKGVDQLKIQRPEGVAVRLYVKGGAKDLRLDHQELGAVGGPVKWETPDFEGATDRYDISVDGGASDLSIGFTG